MRRVLLFLMVLMLISIISACDFINVPKNNDLPTITETPPISSPGDKFDFETDINSDVIALLGSSIGEIEGKYGELDQTEWWNGPIFKHKNSLLWFAYDDLADDYNTTETSSVTGLYGSASDFIVNKTISEKIFTDECKIYDQHDDEYRIHIISNDWLIEIDFYEDGTLDENSLASISVTE